MSVAVTALAAEPSGLYGTGECAARAAGTAGRPAQSSPIQRKDRWKERASEGRYRRQCTSQTLGWLSVEKFRLTGLSFGGGGEPRHATASCKAGDVAIGPRGRWPSIYVTVRVRLVRKSAIRQP